MSLESIIVRALDDPRIRSCCLDNDHDRYAIAAAIVPVIRSGLAQEHGRAGGLAVHSSRRRIDSATARTMAKLSVIARRRKQVQP
jgi:hypothetical protein